MAGLFISYRREDAAADAGRLCEHLQRCCRADVFLDLSTPAGSDFREVLAAKLDACEAVLVLIGPRWLASQHPDGRRRLDDPDDFVRFEIATALAKRKLVVPVLFPGGTLPRTEDLPKDIADIVWREAIDIRYAHWNDDVNALVAHLPASLACTQERGVTRPSTTARLGSAVVPMMVIAAVQTYAVNAVESIQPEVLYLTLSVAIGGLQAFQFRESLWIRAAIAAAIAFGAGMLTSIVVPLMRHQDIVPRSLVPIRLFATFIAGIFAAYLVGAFVVDALLQWRAGRARSGSGASA